MMHPTAHTDLCTSAGESISSSAISGTYITSQLGPYDVLCNRSRKAFNFIGNRRFRVIVGNFSTGYAKSTSKAERSRIVLSIVEIVHRAGGRFLTKAGGDTWTEVSMTKAKEKVGHALRFSISVKESGEELRTRDVISYDAFPEQVHTSKKRKLENDGVEKIRDEVQSADFH